MKVNVNRNLQPQTILDLVANQMILILGLSRHPSKKQAQEIFPGVRFTSPPTHYTTEPIIHIEDGIRHYTTIAPHRAAVPKLIRVPMRTYSVSLRSLACRRSPKRK